MPSSNVTLAPNASIVNVRSRVEFEGITNSISKSNRQAIIASAIPVFPLVASISLVPAFMSPRSSALRTILSAGRSFTLPPGLFPSSFAKMRTLGFGLSFLISAIGVLPIRSIIPAMLLKLYFYRVRLSPGCGKPLNAAERF